MLMEYEITLANQRYAEKASQITHRFPLKTKLRFRVMCYCLQKYVINFFGTEQLFTLH